MVDPQFKAAIQHLQEAEVQFVIIGGVALILQGGAHVTTDIDFSFAPDEANRQKLAETMNAIHPIPLGWTSFEPYVITAEKLQRVRFFNLKTDIGPIDLLPLPAGIDSFDGLWERADVMVIEGLSIRVASIDDLVAMKKAAGRPKDERHLMELYALKKIIAEEEEA